MHETGITKSLLHEVERIAMRYGGPKVKSIKLRIGALSPFSKSHLIDHFEQAAKGTVAEHARLVIEQGTDITDPLAQDIKLVSVEIEDILPMVVRARVVRAQTELSAGKAGTDV